MSKLKWHKLTGLPAKYGMVIGQADLTKLAKKKLELDEYRGLTMISGGAILVYIAEGMDPWEVTDTIIHESVHVFAAIAKHMGEETIGEEFQAYTTAHIATTLLKEYTKLQEIKNDLSGNAVHCNAGGVEKNSDLSSLPI